MKFVGNTVLALELRIINQMSLNPLTSSATKQSNTLKQFVSNLSTSCLSVFDHFLGLALKGLTDKSTTFLSIQVTQVLNIEGVSRVQLLELLPHYQTLIKKCNLNRNHFVLISYYFPSESLSEKKILALNLQINELTTINRYQLCGSIQQQFLREMIVEPLRFLD